MIGPLLLAVSWLLLRLQGRSLSALGFDKPCARSLEFLAGFVLAALVVTVQQLGASLASGVPWQLNPAADAALLGHSLRWNINSVLYEELLFRGYLLWQAIRWLGPRRAVLLDAAAFGIYHWFSYGAFGNPALMAFVFVYTGAFGLMLAMAFAHTRSLAAPIGLHLGWNLTAYLVFSMGPLGPALLLPANGAPRMQTFGLPTFLLDLGLPLLLIIGVCTYLLRRRAAPAAD